MEDFKDILYSEAKKSLEQTLREIRGAKVYRLTRGNGNQNTIYTTQPENRCVSQYAEHVTRYSEPTDTEKVTGALHWLGYFPYWK